MTTFQSFQSEIDQIHAREINRQRVQAALDKEKEANAKKGAKPDAKAVAALGTDPKFSTKPAKADAKAGKGTTAAKPTFETPQAAHGTDGLASPVVDKLVGADDDRVATAEEEAAEVIVCTPIS
jgi:parvulin-like peptidyl-prolyl isomerase